MALNQTDKKKVLKFFWILVASPFVVLSLILILVSLGAFGPMPQMEELVNPRNFLASEVISEDGELLGKFYVENRTYVQIDDLSPHLVNALIAREDKRFMSHSGIDAIGLSRVLFKTILLGREGEGGGSTITQQLAKNLFKRDTTEHNFIAGKWVLFTAKLKEWVTAVRLERNYTKEEIIALYLNTVPFGSETYGIKSAARTFFNKTPDSLKIEEAALLVGVLKGPSKYSPVLNPERSLARRNGVLEKMEEYGYIDEQQLDSLQKIPLTLNYRLQSHNEGPATYFREYLRRTMSATEPKKTDYYSYSRFKEDSVEWATNPLYGWCNKNLKPDGTPYNLYKDGLKIYTTINSKMQRYAEEAVKEHLGKFLQPEFFKEKKNRKKAPFASEMKDGDIKHIMEQAMKRSSRYKALRDSGYTESQIMTEFNKPHHMKVFTWLGEKDTVMSPWDSIKYYKHFLRAGFMAIEPHTGHVKAYVGGINFKHFKYDGVITQKRQVGSTFKPFLYTLAMQEGMTPCDEVYNSPTSFIIGDTVWTPKNSDDDNLGKKVTLKWGLANSVNYISAWVMKQYTPQAVVDLAHKMGLSSYIAPVPSIVLGTADLSLYEMVSAYSTFANKGVHTNPVFVTRIEDKNGNVLSTYNQSPSSEAISEETAYLMINLLEGVVNYGTGVRLRYRYKFTNPIAGKTGTTQNHSDGWFMGVTPTLATGVWVGGEDRGIHFDKIEMGQGANMALPIYALFLQKVLADPSLNFYRGDFERPVNFNISLDCDSKIKSRRSEDPDAIEY